MNIPKTCKAVAVNESKTLTTETIAVPTPGAGQALVKVQAAGVNRADIYQRNGEYPVPPGASPVLGLELAGEIAAVGPAFKRFKVGDRVMSLVAGGAYAEYCVVDEATTSPLPGGLSFVEGAAVPEAYFTIWSNVFDERMAGLKAGETLFLHGGASGVGSAAIQLAKRQGARVIVTAGSAEKCAACLGIGADFAIPYKEKDFVDEVKRFTDGKGVDVILDWVGTDYFDKHVGLLKRFGRLVIIDSHTGDDAKLDLLKLFTRNLHVMGSVLRRRPLDEKDRIRENVEKLWLPALASGLLKPLIHGTFSLENAQFAHDLMEKSTHQGKVVLTP